MIGGARFTRDYEVYRPTPELPGRSDVPYLGIGPESKTFVKLGVINWPEEYTASW